MTSLDDVEYKAYLIRLIKSFKALPNQYAAAPFIQEAQEKLYYINTKLDRKQGPQQMAPPPPLPKVLENIESELKIINLKD